MSNTSLTLSATLGDKLARLPRLLWQSVLVQWPFHLIAIGYALTTWWMLRDVPQYKQAPIEGLALGIITFTFPIGIVAVFLFRLGHHAACSLDHRHSHDDVHGAVQQGHAGIEADDSADQTFRV
jgi:hypothetical protein